MFYPFPPLFLGTLLRRYKRFMADIELDSGETITAHCPNTGPMTGVYLPGNRVAVSMSQNPKRKYAYTWELIEVQNVQDNEPTWVGVNTSLPNRVVKRALEQRLFSPIGSYQAIESEVVYGQEGSRVDFRLLPADTSPDRRLIYLEVKNTTWAKGNLALFPDTVTTRGQKHLRELTALLPQHRSILLYFINRGDCTQFTPGDMADPAYGKLLRTAIVAGLEILPCRFKITLEGMEYLNLAELIL
ncbi:MAG: DNA/RNA nuclease SfsA [Prochlorotrichaceae cyanobacterium]